MGIANEGENIRGVLRRLLGGSSPTQSVFAFQKRCVDAAVDQLLNDFLDENTAMQRLRDGWQASITGTRVLQLDAAAKLSLLFAAAVEILEEKPNRTIPGASAPFQPWFRILAAKELVSVLLKKALPYAEGDLELLVTSVASCRAFKIFPLAGLLHVISSRAANGMVISREMNQALDQLGQVLQANAVRSRWPESKKYAKTVDRLLGRVNANEQIDSMKICPGEAWSDAAIADLANLSADLRAKWMDILLHANSAHGTKPTKTWLKTADHKISSLGYPEFYRLVSGWFALIEKTRTQRKPLPTDRWTPDPNFLIEESHATLLKGLAWCCIGCDDLVLTRSLGDAACAAFKKVPKLGPRCVKFGNAAVIALSVMKGDEPIAQLGRLSANVKHQSVRRYVAKGLDKVAQRTGQTPEDLSELAVPTFGLDTSGKLLRSFGEYTAQIEVLAGDEVKLSWLHSDGKMQKSLPGEIKSDHSGVLKELNRNVKDIRKMLPAQRVRLERLLMGRRSWSPDEWRRRYVDHPLMGNMARRLIWEFETDGNTHTGIIFGGRTVGFDDQPVSIKHSTLVRLWHPIHSNPETVQSWRAWLERNQLTQPFKQAHREIYVLTDAELQTATYSNRFAAHIVRQHQLAALAQSRGWTYRLQGAFDSHNSPTLRLPQNGLRVEYWLEPIEQDTTPAGIFTHVSTDQVRFFELDEPEPMNLANVDRLLFTEIMRDVDLFVGVASVGNDPAWRDAGNDRLGNYWHTYSFGELGESAETRKSVLENLIPRLKIAARCSIADKFLIVRGDLHTYKIHLGSGNILIASNDQYLCIVPDRSRTHGEIYLPFEGDSILSIILSKAFLLADDRSIKDISIVRQLRR